MDSEGSVFTTGWFAGTVDFDPGLGVANLTSAGQHDIFLSKLDNSGDYVWAKRIGGTSEDTGVSVAVDSAGILYATGYFEGTMDFDGGLDGASMTAVGSHDIFLTKLAGQAPSQSLPLCTWPLCAVVAVVMSIVIARSSGVSGTKSRSPAVRWMPEFSALRRKSHVDRRYTLR